MVTLMVILTAVEDLVNEFVLRLMVELLTRDVDGSILAFSDIETNFRELFRRTVLKGCSLYLQRPTSVWTSLLRS